MRAALEAAGARSKIPTVFKSRCSALAAGFLIALAPHAANAFDDCSAPGYLGAADDRVGDVASVCMEADRFQISTPKGSREVRIVHTDDLPTTDLPTMVREIRRGVQQSAAQLRALGELAPADITIWISHLLPSAEAPADEEDDHLDLQGQATVVDDGCLFSLYPGATGRRELATTTAHEFFHCVQANELPDSYHMDASTWWVEGSADWFAALVFHDADLSIAIDNFDAISNDTSLTSMSYASVVFFFWMGQVHGNDAVVQLLRAMPTSGSEAAQQRALAALLTPEEWQDFAQDYLAGRIVRPGGRALTNRPFPGNVYVWSEGRPRHEFSAPAFVLARAQLEFPCGTWSIRETHESGTRAYREHDDPWQDALPERVVVSDDNPRLFQMAGFSTEPAGLALAIEALKDVCQRCENESRAMETELNRCLIGSWELVSGGYGAEIQRQLEATGIFEQIEYPDLHGIFVLEANGRYRQGPDDDKTPSKTTIRSDAGKLWTGLSVLELNQEGSWSTEGDTLYLCEEQKSIDLDLTLIHPEGLEEKLSTGKDHTDTLGLRRKREYECQQNQLLLTESLPGAPSVSWEYRRR